MEDGICIIVEPIISLYQGSNFPSVQVKERDHNIWNAVGGSVCLQGTRSLKCAEDWHHGQEILMKIRKNLTRSILTSFCESGQTVNARNEY